MRATRSGSVEINSNSLETFNFCWPRSRRIVAIRKTKRFDVVPTQAFSVYCAQGITFFTVCVPVNTVPRRKEDMKDLARIGFSVRGTKCPRDRTPNLWPAMVP